jgi:preprotein translocase subunit SecE
MNPVETVKDWSGRSKQFYLDVRNEMKKISWPGKQEVISTTIVVLVAVAFFGLYLGLLDALLGSGLAKLLAYFHAGS